MRTYASKELAIKALKETAKAYLGVKEGSLLHKQIIDRYNAVKPRPRGYVVTYSDAWCATFVTYIFDTIGLSDLIYRECGCQEMINGMKKMNIIHSEKTKFFEGDIVFYDWNLDNHSDHVGIVTSVNTNSKEVTVIEGNKDDMVAYRTIPYNYNFIECVAHPKYERCVAEKPDYENIGWNKDAKGWWYAYAHNKGAYYANCIKTINGQDYMFDIDGYLCDGHFSTFNDSGSIKEIRGNYIG